MSDDSLQLSPTLLKDLLAVLQNNDPRAQEPPVAVQYLAAVTGYLVAQIDEPRAERQECLRQLAQFTLSVFEDVAEHAERPSVPAQPDSGVWRPGDP